MSLIIHAPNVHQGGGRTLLTALLESIRFPCTLIVDERMPIQDDVYRRLKVIHVRATLVGRFSAERYLQRLCRPGDRLICFGNLPPLFKSRARVYIYLQNRLLCTEYSLQGFPIKVRARIALERYWLRRLIRSAQLVVQTEAMRNDVMKSIGVSAKVLPILPRKYHMVADNKAKVKVKKFDFLYVATGEPYKNHSRLVEAWAILSSTGCRPTLCLTLNEQNVPGRLLDTIKRHKLAIEFKEMDNAKIGELYAEARALIYPSLIESFGLPLYEAKYYGLAIVASNRDFVREAVCPNEYFNPESSKSIASAVMRFLGSNKQFSGTEKAVDIDKSRIEDEI